MVDVHMISDEDINGLFLLELEDARGSSFRQGVVMVQIPHST